MIQPQELRIGNLLNHSELGIVEVIGVGKDYIHVIYNGVTHYENIRSFSTIPLTEEILLKFGFVSGGDNDYFENEINEDYFLYYLLSESSLTICNLTKEHIEKGDLCEAIKLPEIVHSLHQLQNLFFSLCGEELTVK